MKSNLLKAQRVANGYTQTDMASFIEKTLTSYAKKELGQVEFTFGEMVIITKKLNLSVESFNDIFFDGQLQFGNSQISSVS